MRNPKYCKNVTTISRQGDLDGNGSLDAAESASLVYDSLGRPTSGIDAAWHPVSYTYDARDRITGQTDGASGAWRALSYDRNDALVASA